MRRFVTLLVAATLALALAGSAAGGGSSNSIEVASGQTLARGQTVTFLVSSRYPIWVFGVTCEHADGVWWAGGEGRGVITDAALQITLGVLGWGQPWTTGGGSCIAELKASRKDSLYAGWGTTARLRFAAAG